MFHLVFVVATCCVNVLRMLTSHIGRVERPDAASVLLCIECNNSGCLGNIECYYDFLNPSYCYMMWARQNNTDIVLRGGCYSTNDETCGSYCITHTSLNVLTDVSDDGFPMHRSLHYFCCCNTSKCNQYYSLSKVDTNISKLNKSVNAMDGKTLTWLIFILLMILVVISEVIIGVVIQRRRKYRKYASTLEIPLIKRGNNASKDKYLVKRMPRATLGNIIYRGTNTKIYQANLIKDNSTVAVKIYNQTDISGWKRECKTLLYHKVQHDNILYCLGSGLIKIHTNVAPGLLIPSKSLYTFKSRLSFHYLLMMEYHPVGSLDKYLQNNTVSIKEALVFITGICSGLAFMHRMDSSGFKPVIVHRDLKGSNILIKNDGTCCISDFGLAIDITTDYYDERITQVGTIRYMAPEILEGCIIYRRDILPMIDIYSFGLVIWEILTRCHDSEEYFQIFERAYCKELGASPTLQMAHHLIVLCKIRPTIPTSWRNIPGVMIECWEHNPETRISSNCAFQRIKPLNI